MCGTRGKQGGGEGLKHRASEVVEVRVSGRLKDHLNEAAQVVGLTKAELMRRAFDEYYGRLRKFYELPK